MEFRDVLFGRRSVREYTARPVEKAQIEALVEAASQAPSAMNAQPWTFTVVQDQDFLTRLSARAKTYMLEHAAPGVGASAFRTQLLDPAFHIFYHAPVLILSSGQAAGPWAAEDCALAAENLMLAAYAAGLGSCWIGFAQRWLQTDDGRKFLGLSTSQLPVAPIIVGYPRETPKPTERHRPHIAWIGTGGAGEGA